MKSPKQNNYEGYPEPPSHDIVAALDGIDRQRLELLNLDQEQLEQLEAGGTLEKAIECLPEYWQDEARAKNVRITVALEQYPVEGSSVPAEKYFIRFSEIDLTASDGVSDSYEEVLVAEATGSLGYVIHHNFTVKEAETVVDLVEDRKMYKEIGVLPNLSDDLTRIA